MHAFDYLYLPIHLFDLTGYFVGIPQGQRAIDSDIREQSSLARFFLDLLVTMLFRNFIVTNTGCLVTTRFISFVMWIDSYGQYERAVSAVC